MFSGEEAPGGAPLPAAQWAEQRRRVLRDSGPAGQVSSSIPRRVSAHPQNCDTYSRCGLLSRLAPQVIRRGQLLSFCQGSLNRLKIGWQLCALNTTSIFISHSS